MKHVFVINSHTTFLTSCGVVEYLGLRGDDVIFIYTRKYKNSIAEIPYKIIDATEICDSCENITENYEQKVSDVDKIIGKYIGGKYYLYVPHLWHWFFQLLYTNKQCRKVSYVQEGGPAQSKVYINDVSYIDRIKSFIRLALLHQRIFESKWYIKGCIYKQLCLDSYAINDAYFHYLPSRNHIVQWPSVKLDLNIDTKAPIFIFDGYVKNGLVEYNIYMDACKKVITQYAGGANYVKFHPAQEQEERNTILSFFVDNGYNVNAMTDAIPTEYVILQFSSLTFIGFTSSLLYYAHDKGHNVICCEDEIINKSSTFRKYIDDCGFVTYKETYIKY